MKKMYYGQSVVVVLMVLCCSLVLVGCKPPPFVDLADKVVLAAITTPPRPFGVILIDKRNPVEQTYAITAGESVAGISVLERSKDGWSVLLRIDGETGWVKIEK